MSETWGVYSVDGFCWVGNPIVFDEATAREVARYFGQGGDRRLLALPTSMTYEQTMQAAIEARKKDPRPSDGLVRKRRAADLTDVELEDELRKVQDAWDRDPASDDEGHGGSPGEWMVERMGELEQEQAKRRRSKRGAKR